MNNTSQNDLGRPILITGGAGSVGLQLTERFVSTGQAVRVFDLPFMDFSPLEMIDNVEIQRGDITNSDSIKEAVYGVKAVVHLAAILPPKSESDRRLTFSVNVDGTGNILRAIESLNSSCRLIFSSSISTYGTTADDDPPIRTDHEQRPIDNYAESKIEGEKLILASSVNTIILRIAPVAVPAFLEPPSTWPFTLEQRVEMIHRDDVVDALFGAANKVIAGQRILNIAGGSTWQLTGSDYITDYYGFMGAPVEEAICRDSPGWVDWYDTVDSQNLLNFQNRSYQQYSKEMQDIIQRMMDE